MAVNIDNHGMNDTLHDVAGSNKAVQRFYRWNAPIYDWTRPLLLRRRREAVEALRLRPGARALEIGCGTGLNFTHLAKAVRETGRIVGIDLSVDMLKRASRRKRPNVDLILADAARLPFRERFDGILFSYSLTIIPGWEQAVACAFDLLTPEGNVVVLDFGQPPTRFAPLRTLFHRYLAVNHVDTHRNLAQALARHANSVERLRPATAFTTILRGSR